MNVKFDYTLCFMSRQTAQSDYTSVQTTNFYLEFMISWQSCSGLQVLLYLAILDTGWKSIISQEPRDYS